MTEKHVDPRPGDGLAGQRVVVTGATGFIGRRLIDALLKLECDVTALLRTRHGAAALEQAGDILVSNIVGSNIVNIALGVGIAGLMFSFDRARREYAPSTGQYPEPRKSRIEP